MSTATTTIESQADETTLDPEVMLDPNQTVSEAELISLPNLRQTACQGCNGVGRYVFWPGKRDSDPGTINCCLCGKEWKP